MADLPMMWGMSPIIFIFFISIVLSLGVTLVYRFTTDQALMKQLKADLKKYQTQMKEQKDDPAKMMESQKLMMSANSKYMMQSFKPMLLTIIPFLIIFRLLGGVYGGLTIIPLNFHVPLSGLETGLGWVGVYIIFSMVFTTVFRKLLKVV